MEDLHPYDIAILTLFNIIAVLGSIGNLCLLASIFNNSALRRTTHILIMNQALSDFLLSALSIPLRVLRISVKKSIFQSAVLSSDSYCYIISGVNAAVLGVSSFGLVLLTVDKFLAAKRPFLYRTRVYIKYTSIAIVISWLIPLVMGLCGAYIPALQTDLNDHKHDVACIKGSTFSKAFALCAYVMMQILPLMIISPLYISITVKVKRSWRILQRSVANEDILHQPFPGNHGRTENNEARRKKELRLTIGIVLILGIHLCCLAPIVIQDYIHIILASHIPYKLDEIFLLLLHLNAVVDPIIHTKYSPDIRRTMYRLFHRYSNRVGAL